MGKAKPISSSPQAGRRKLFLWAGALGLLGVQPRLSKFAVFDDFLDPGFWMSIIICVFLVFYAETSIEAKMKRATNKHESMRMETDRFFLACIRVHSCPSVVKLFLQRVGNRGKDGAANRHPSLARPRHAGLAAARLAMHRQRTFRPTRRDAARNRRG